MSNRRRPRLLRVLSFVLGALVVGGAIGPAAVLAADPPPTTGSRQVIAPFMDTRSMPNRSIACPRRNSAASMSWNTPFLWAVAMR